MYNAAQILMRSYAAYSNSICFEVGRGGYYRCTVDLNIHVLSVVKYILRIHM